MIVGARFRDDIVLMGIRKPACDVRVSDHSTENILLDKPFLDATLAELSQVLGRNISPAALPLALLTCVCFYLRMN
jgi:hypothetical protein